MYYIEGNMTRNLDIPLSGFTNKFYQVRDSRPAMTSPTAPTASESCSARGAPRVPSQSQVSKLWCAEHDNQTQLQSIRYTFVRSHDACICRHCLFSFKFSHKDCMSKLFLFSIFAFLDVRYRRHEVHFIWGPSLAQRLLHLLQLQELYGGQGLHHGRWGHHLPGVRQEEAHGRHGGAVRGSMRMIIFIDVLIFS